MKTDPSELISRLEKTVIADIRVLPLRFISRYLYKFSQCVFNFFAWMLLTCLFLATGQETDNQFIEYTGIFLCGLLIVTLIVTSFKAMIFVQDQMIEWSISGNDFRILKQVISFTVTMTLVFSMMVFIAFTLNTFREVLSNFKVFA